MRRLAGAGEVKVDLKSAEGVIRPAKGKTFDPNGIPEALKSTPFTPGEIEVTAVGTLARKNGSLLLEMPGVVRQFLLSGGRKADELGRRKEVVGKRIEVKGKLASTPNGPGLSVESWKPENPRIENRE